MLCDLLQDKVNQFLLRSAEGFPIQPSHNTILAELGSLNLEFTRLSQLTKDNKYFDAAQRVMNQMEEAQKKTKIPGLWPMMVDAENMEFTDPRFTVGGMADSMYEYLPKQHIILGAQTDQYRRMYAAAIEPIKERLLFRPMTKDNRDILIAGNARSGFTSGKSAPEPQGEHLKCFIGGMVGVGAKVFNRPEELSTARKLVDGCVWAYDIMPTGIMPEIFSASPCEKKDVCNWDEEKWYRDLYFQLGHGTAEDLTRDAKALIKKHGLQPGLTAISDANYKLRYVS